MAIWSDLSARHLQGELMDQPELDTQRHVQALRGLERINRWSRSGRIVWQPVARLARQTGRRLRLLDLATGAGDLPLELWRRAQRAGLALELAGCDFSPRAVQFARLRAHEQGAEVHFFQQDVLAEPLPQDWDVLTCSLFLHHLTDEQAQLLLDKMAGAARHLVVVSDLARSHWGLTLAWLATRLLSASDVVRTDGPRSVEAAFTLPELAGLAGRVPLDGVRIDRRWPCRLLLQWSKGA